MSGAYDLTVIGSGPGGCAAALTAARRGLRTALVEREQVGGVCLNVGCIPTKALVAVAHLLRRVRQAGQMGVKVEGVSLDFTAVRARNDRILTTLRQGLTDLLRREGVEIIPGEAAFESPNALTLTRDGKTSRLESQRFVIAVGGRPLSGPWTFDEQRLLSYRGLLALEAVPASLLIIGGGVIGCEFASCFAAFGTQITIVEPQPQLLPGEDAEAVRWLTRRFQAEGMSIRTGATVKQLTSSGTGVNASLSDGTSVSAERCLIAIGQRPNLVGLCLERASVATGAGVTVDAHLRSSQPHIAAIGDCLERHGLAHWAAAEGAVAVRNLLSDPPESVDPLEVPRCIFTEPEIAQIGAVDERAEGARVSRMSFGALGKGHCDDETEGFVKLIVDAATDRVLGATIIGAQASAIIHAAGLAVRHGLTAKQLARTITAHPTFPEGLTEAAAHLYGESLVMAARRSRTVSR